MRCFINGKYPIATISHAWKAKGEFNDLRVGTLHLAHLIDSVVRLDDDGGFIPARSRVRRLQSRATTSTPPVATTPVDREKGGDAAGTVSVSTKSTAVCSADG